MNWTALPTFLGTHHDVVLPAIIALYESRIQQDFPLSTIEQIIGNKVLNIFKGLCQCLIG